MDPLVLVLSLAFYALFGVSVRRYLRFRTSVDRYVMLVFGSFAGLFVLSFANTLLPQWAPYISPVSVTLLVAQPVLMLGLVRLFVRLPRSVIPAAAAAFVTVIGLYYLTNRSVPSLLLLLAYFMLAEAAAAMMFLREAGRRLGFPRLRLALAGIASLLFGLAILVPGTSSAARGGGGSDAAVLLISRSLALLAALGYLAAFAPPRWLARLAHRALAFDLVRSVVSASTGDDPRVYWRALALASASVLGTDHVRVWRGDELLADGHPEPIPPTGTMGGQSIGVPLVIDGRHVATVTAHLQSGALFLEDDLALIETLGSLTARAVEREQAVVGLAEARRAVAEAAAVRASEARFRALLDAEPNAMLAVDSAGRIRWSTRSAGDMFGSESALAGKRIESLIEPRRPMRRTGEHGSAMRYETTGHGQDGRSFPAEVAVTHFEFDGEPFDLVVVSDVSWRHEADAIRERFIGVLSHELRTPITAIFGGSQLLLHRGGQMDKATRTELLTDIAGESERLQRMIENLLVLAKVEAGGEVVDKGPILLHRVLPAVIAREQTMWPQMTISTEMPVSLPPATGDEASLGLALRNLISNAGKYAGPGARVRVVVARESDQISVRVLDDGPGIDASEADRLFELYFRAQGTQSVPGSGIGLFVCQHLVAAMGGRSWARSRPEGGAEFGFSLPVYSDLDEETAAPEPNVAGATGATARTTATVANRPVAAPARANGKDSAVATIRTDRTPNGLNSGGAASPIERTTAAATPQHGSPGQAPTSQPAMTS